MIQIRAFDRINVAHRVAVMNDPYENFGCSDFFNSLSHNPTYRGFSARIDSSAAVR
jgi:hypothetical protein